MDQRELSKSHSNKYKGDNVDKDFKNKQIPKAILLVTDVPIKPAGDSGCINRGYLYYPKEK